MILLHMAIMVVCYEVMKHGNRVNSFFCIEVFPFKMNVTYLQCVYISSRMWCNECTMLPCMLAFLHLSLGCRSLTVLVGVMLQNCVPSM